jgi:hypothetical protein
VICGSWVGKSDITFVQGHMSFSGNVFRLIFCGGCFLCVVRELTDDSRRGADGTAHKINWTNEHYRGGELSQERPAYGGRQSTIVQLWAFSVSFKGSFETPIPYGVGRTLVPGGAREL